MNVTIRRFEPGDTTTYRAVLIELDDDAKAAWGGGVDLLYGFGTPSNVAFIALPKDMYLDLSYYLEKSGQKSFHTAVVALYVYRHLTDTEVGGSHLPALADLRWKSGWEAQLK